VSATFFYARMDTLTTEGSVAFPGKYDTNVWITAAGLTWRRAP
jgi:hypothetical protein